MPPVAGDPPRVASQPALWRITDRGAFARLRRDGARAHGHGLSVTWVPSPRPTAAPPRVAFAVGRRAGGAVGRNRVRRRLRSACRELAERRALPPGDYLVGAGPDAAARPWGQLVEDLQAVVARAARSSR